MSGALVKWARQQRAGGSGRKSVLIVLASLADKSGAVNISMAALGEICELSVKALREHLAHIEAAGLIERQAKWWPHSQPFHHQARRASGALRSLQGGRARPLRRRAR